MSDAIGPNNGKPILPGWEQAQAKNQPFDICALGKLAQAQIFPKIEQLALLGGNMVPPGIMSASKKISGIGFASKGP